MILLVHRREVAEDPLTGQKYERYIGDFAEISDTPLENTDEEFDDQFEEDILDEKIMQLASNHVSSHDSQSRINEEMGPDLSASRWSIYDAFSTTLEKYEI